MAHWTTCEKCHRVITYEGAIQRGEKWYCTDCAPTERKPKNAPKAIELDNIDDSLTGG